MARYNGALLPTLNGTPAVILTDALWRVQSLLYLMKNSFAMIMLRA